MHGVKGNRMYELKRPADEADWTALDVPGVAIKILHTDAATGASTVLTRIGPGAIIPQHRHTKADETVYVIEGDFVEDGQSYGPGSFFAGSAGTNHGPHSSTGGCIVLTRFSAALDFVL